MITAYENGYSRLSKEDLCMFRALICRVVYTPQKQEFQSFPQADWTQYVEWKYIYWIDILQVASSQVHLTSFINMD